VPVTSAVRTPDGRGYWILFANGAISIFGDAGTFGSPLGLIGGSDPATAILSTSDGGTGWRQRPVRLPTMEMLRMMVPCSGPNSMAPSSQPPAGNPPPIHRSNQLASSPSKG
jgi:hypothetical protein